MVVAFLEAPGVCPFAAPASRSALAEASERARPMTSCHAARSFGTRPEPMLPLAPVTNTRVDRFLSSRRRRQSWEPPPSTANSAPVV